MAQKWGDQAEIAIADAGRGIHDSLRESHDIPNAEVALREAIKPGVSRLREPQNQSEWDNTGFGLYIVSELGRQYGSFQISSSGMWLGISLAGERLAGIALRGTVIKLSVDTRNAEYFPNILHGIVVRGEQMYQGLTGRRKIASKSSSGLW